jgi:hypothetical protein
MTQNSMGLKVPMVIVDNVSQIAGIQYIDTIKIIPRANNKNEITTVIFLGGEYVILFIHFILLVIYRLSNLKIIFWHI